MPHVLEQKMAAVRRRVRRLLLIAAATRVAAIAMAAAFVLGTFDYLIHFERSGGRLLASLVLLGVAGWSCHRFLWPVLRARLSDVDLALQLERRLPILHDRLASALRFLRQPEDDVLAGSALLRRSVIAEATAEIDRLNLDEALEPRAARQGLGLAAACLGVLLAAAAFDAPATGIALARLAWPWRDIAWPRQNHLEFVVPVQRLAAGQTFEVEVRDERGARLPDDVCIQYRYADSSAAPATKEPMRWVSDALVARKEHVTRPFAYRAVGGDDFSMPWIDLEIVEPPVLANLTITLHYPAYTGWPPEEGETHLRALVGTRVEFSGKVNKPLTAAKLHVDDGEPIAAQLSDDARGFSLGPDGGFKIERSGSYWIELVDREGFAGGEADRYEIRAVEDFSPTVTFERPPSTGVVTPNAKLPLSIAAKDDLLLKQVALRMSRSDRSEQDETEIVVYQGPEQASPAPRPAAELEKTTPFAHRLDLGPLTLKPGTQLAIQATATDYYPHQGQSDPLRLTVVTVDELRERLAERQNLIVGELTRILKLQRDARSLVSGAEIQLETVGQLDKPDIDHLLAAELLQRQIERGLVGASEGVLGQITSLLEDFRNNSVDNPEFERQMLAVRDEVDRLGRETLPPLAGEMTAALKTAQADPQDSAAASTSAAKGSFAAVGRGQDEVIETLERLTATLAESEDYRRFHREMSTVRRQQEELARESAELARRTLTKEASKLTAQERADAEKLAARQLDLARQFDKIQQRMQRTTEEVAGRDPLWAGSVADALMHAREQALSRRMHESGREIGNNRLGQALAAQRLASDGLQEVLDILANRREHELGRLVKKLREEQERLEELRARQQGLQKKWQAAAEETDEAARRRELQRLTREQRQTAEEAERMARSLTRLQAERAGQKTSQSGAKMSRAGTQGDQGQASAAAEAAQQAESDLEQAEQELARRLAEAEADVAQEQVTRLDDQLAVLAEGERKLLEETRHYADVERSQGELTRAQAVSVGDLAKNQKLLEQDTASLAGKLTSTPVFRLALEHAAQRMQRAATLLTARQTDELTQQAQERAIDLLVHAREALKPSPREQLDQPPDANGEEGQQPNQQQSSGPDATQALAEMKLLRWMQDDVNARTKALEDACRDTTLRDTTELPPEALREYQELSAQQGLIAELLAKLAGGSESDEEAQSSMPADDNDP